MLGIFKKSKRAIVAPITGKVIPLEKVNDQVFASGIMGKGVAVIPDEDVYVAPVDGTITIISETKHAFGMKTDNGLELLVHIGIDSVYLKGEGYTVLTPEGTKVKQGTPIIKIDRDVFAQKNISLETPVLVLNHTEYEIDILENSKCEVGKTELMKY